MILIIAILLLILAYLSGSLNYAIKRVPILLIAFVLSFFILGMNFSFMRHRLREIGGGS